jgi:NAD(P)-dependent dehydrogenase (short-subunit alcohol dehydrogenase family)
MESPPRKVALVTASSAGLGAATARAFASAGYSTIFNYFHNADKANALVDDVLKAIGTSGNLTGDAGHTERQRCIAIKADLSRREEIQRLVEEAVRAMGRLDVVVSNQGWTQMRNFNEIEDNVVEGDWDGCFNMNVKSHLWLFHSTKPHLQDSKGSFVGVASLAGVIPSGSSIVCCFRIWLLPVF